MEVAIFIISGLLLFVGFYAKFHMDKSGKDGFPPGDIRNRTISSNNKYAMKDGVVLPYQKKWYYPRWYHPEFEEAFPFSTNALVFRTDYWHKMQFIFLNTIILSLSLMAELYFQKIWSVALVFVVLRLIYAVAFNIGFIKKN
jgi:hypothetical protein